MQGLLIVFQCYLSLIFTDAKLKLHAADSFYYWNFYFLSTIQGGKSKSLGPVLMYVCSEWLNFVRLFTETNWQASFSAFCWMKKEVLSLSLLPVVLVCFFFHLNGFFIIENVVSQNVQPVKSNRDLAIIPIRWFQSSQVQVLSAVKMKYF